MKSMCIKKLNENTKCFKFNECDEVVLVKGGRPPIYYNTAIRYNNYLVNIRKLINTELQSECT